MRPAPQRSEATSGLRRRRFTAPHRRRALRLRLLRQFAIATLVVAVPVGVGAWVLISPRFHLRTIELSGTERVSRQWVDERVAPLEGRHLLRLSLADLEAELAGHRWIAGVAMRKRLPDTLAVRIVERRPAALLRRDDGLHYVDHDGRLIDRYDAGTGPTDLLLVRVPAGGEAGLGPVLVAAAEFVRLAPDWGSQLSEVEVIGESDLRFHTAALPFALVLGVGGVEAGLRRLRRYLPEVRHGLLPAAAVDLRFSGRIVAVPTLPPHGEEG
ncbi:MAG: cell division protein FtsQ/DivIB [Thermoanaerobaculia bacterium]